MKKLALVFVVADRSTGVIAQGADDQSAKARQKLSGFLFPEGRLVRQEAGYAAFFHFPE